MSVATDQNVIHARDMCKHALLRRDCRVCVPLFCSHGHTRFECEHCIHAIQLSSPDMSELSTLKREKARQRQIKSRLKNQVLTASPVYVPRQRRIKRCVESELLNASPITGCSFPVPSTLMSSCCPSGRCALCGNKHANEILCPPVNSFEFYSSVQISEPHL